MNNQSQPESQQIKKPQSVLNYFKFAVGGVLGFVLLRKYVNGPLCTLNTDLAGKVSIITGANSGIGLETAKRLAKHGSTVILACRNLERSQKALKEIQASYPQNKNIQLMRLDLGNLESVIDFAKEFNEKYDKLDILVANAGVFALKERELTPQGYEKQFGTNHMAHALLFKLLDDKLVNSQPSRIISVSSKGNFQLLQLTVYLVHFESFPKLLGRNGEIFFDDYTQRDFYTPFGAYSQSKLANLMYAKGLAAYYAKQGKQIKVVSLHPGGIKTNLSNHLFEESFVKQMMINLISVFSLKTIVYGAQTTIQCAMEDYDKLESGAYYSDCKIAASSDYSKNDKYIDQLFQYTQKEIENFIKHKA